MGTVMDGGFAEPKGKVMDPCAQNCQGDARSNVKVASLTSTPSFAISQYDHMLSHLPGMMSPDGSLPAHTKMFEEPSAPANCAAEVAAAFAGIHETTPPARSEEEGEALGVTEGVGVPEGMTGVTAPPPVGNTHALASDGNARRTSKLPPKRATTRPFTAMRHAGTPRPAMIAPVVEPA